MSSKENINECRDLSQAQFQEELDRWFQRRGIISDLRSHLRHLMVMALQNTQIGPKSSDESSPKAQALNLLVAEYLLRHKCHYTLSVFTSEVPALTDFSRSLYCRMSVRQDISSNCQKINRSKACCQENNNAFQVRYKISVKGKK